MSDAVKDLNERLQAIETMVSQTAFLSFLPGSKEQIRETVSGIKGKIDAFTEQTLTVGILGGTGVGKSSLMNALAGSPISSTDHRRPHTDAILMYRHGDTPLPQKLRHADLEWKDITHEAEAIGQILLCDFPDFDSILAGHRDRVIGFIDHLDLLIWMVSPEKYGDARFHEFLHSLSKSKDNFLFVLNKADIFFDGTTLEEGHSGLGKVTERLRAYLKQGGIDNARLYVISADEALRVRETSSWNQFSTLRREVFRQREVKEVRHIKASNIEADIHDLTRALKDETAPLDLLGESLSGIIASLEAEAPALEENAERFTTEAAERQYRGTLRRKATDTSLLVGPTSALYHATVRWLKHSSEQDEIDASAAMEMTVDRVHDFFTRQFGSLKDRIILELMRNNIPAPITGRVRDMLLMPEGETERYDRLYEIFRAGSTPGRTVTERIFRLLQYASYLFVAILFLFALGGEESTKQIVGDPGWGSVLSFLATMAFALFSLRGLIALASFLIVNGILAYRFSSRYRRIIETKIDRCIAGLSKNTGRLWRALFENRIAALRHLCDDIDRIGAALEDMESRRSRPARKAEDKKPGPR